MKNKISGPFILALQEIDKSKQALAGGKAANLGELSRIEGICVPEGFCITTKAWQSITQNNRQLNELLNELSHLKADERDNISSLSASIRSAIETTAIPGDMANEIMVYLSKYGEKDAYAVRSSATAEDLPTASFAGQQDTYLNITGKEAILQHISKCWASLFTERAVIYRMQHGFDHRRVQLAVVVQKMVFPQVSGILFTADPVNSNRKILSIDASFGLGEALVSGIVNADNYRLREGRIIAKKVSAKTLAVYASKNGGIKKKDIAPEKQNIQALTDKQIMQLEQLGRKIEAHFGGPQDIEWCLADDSFYIVQSRPITTLFPVPEANDQENHVYLSVGHQQMMTDALKPLGLSIRQLTAARPMFTAAGRQFVDISQQLSTAAGREGLLNMIGQHEPLTRGAIEYVIEKNFIKLLPGDDKGTE